MKTTQKTTAPDYKTALNQVEKTLHLYLVEKAPSIPDNIKELIVKYGPYIALIMIIFTLPVILFALGVGTLLVPISFLGGVSSGVSFSFASLIVLAEIILEAVAIPGLFKRKLSAWRLLYYASLLGGLYALFTLNLGSLILGTGLSLYILFQIKSYYK